MKKLRNLNRGIILFIVLIIGFGGYIVYDNIRFKKEKPAIEKVVTEYFEQIGEMNLLPKQYRKLGEPVPKEIIQKKIADNNKLIDQYWTKKSGNDYRVKEGIKTELKRLFENQQLGNNKIQDATCSVKKVSGIKKTSPNGATATVEFFLSLELQQSAEFYNGTWWLNTANDGYVSENGSNTQQLGTYQITITLELEMTRVHGEWKISSTGNSYSSSRGGFTPHSDDTVTVE